MIGHAVCCPSYPSCNPNNASFVNRLWRKISPDRQSRIRMPSLAELLANLRHCRVCLGNVISFSSHVCPLRLLSSTNCINSILAACCECFGDISGTSLSDDCVLASPQHVLTYWCFGDDCVRFELQLTVGLCVREVSS